MHTTDPNYNYELETSVSADDLDVEQSQQLYNTMACNIIAVTETEIINISDKYCVYGMVY